MRDATIGRALADLCDLLNPQAIVVGGDLAAVGEPFLEAIGEVIGRRILPATAPPVELRAGSLGDRAEVLGALALVTGDSRAPPLGRARRARRGRLTYAVESGSSSTLSRVIFHARSSSSLRP